MGNCKICKAELNVSFKIREMMLGTREEFEYAQCPQCSTIQVLNIPDNIASYYPNYYYSFIEQVPVLKPLSFIKQVFKNIRMRKKYRTKNDDILKYLKPLNIKPGQRILDIGCGKGKLICEMFNLGFTNVAGTDKFINEEYDYGYGVKVFKKDLNELKRNSFDLLMMHHAYEHMSEPLEELKKCYDLLKSNGHLMIRIPVFGMAWEKYKQNWIQLDAPRHFFIHTEQSMKILAKESGFMISDVVYDSSAFQFWGSELYKQDIALVNPTTKAYVNRSDFFSETQLGAYEEQASILNLQKKGDQAIFYLRKS